MFTRRKLAAGFAAVLLSPIGVSLAADATATRKFPLPERGDFQMTVPTAWNDQLHQPPQALPPTIAFRARQGKPFEVLVTPIWRARPGIPVATKDTIRQNVQKAANDAKSQAVEEAISIVEFSGSAGPGYYFSATDKAPKPGEYKYMTQGMLKVNDLTVTFTILTNDGQEQVTTDAIGMLKSAVHVQP